MRVQGSGFRVWAYIFSLRFKVLAMVLHLGGSPNSTRERGLDLESSSVISIWDRVYVTVFGECI